MAKKRMEEISDRRAKKLGLEWKIQVAVVLERLPVVLADKADWERDYDNLRTYLDQFGRDYPEALMGKMEIEEIEDLTDEAILGKSSIRSWYCRSRTTFVYRTTAATTITIFLGVFEWMVIDLYIFVAHT